MEEIKISELDSNFKYEIASQPGGENFKRCFSCGTCTASCPVAEVSEQYDPRKLIRMSILGMRKEVLSSDVIWMCARCYTCSVRCPQNVKFGDVMGVLREMAVNEGYVHKARIQEMEEMDKFAQDLRCNIVQHLISPTPQQQQKIESMLKDRLNLLKFSKG